MTDIVLEPGPGPRPARERHLCVHPPCDIERPRSTGRAPRGDIPSEPAAEALRGEPVQVLMHLYRMAADLPQLAEADFNPVPAAPDRVTVLDTRIRLLPRRPQNPYLRRLR